MWGGVRDTPPSRRLYRWAILKKVYFEKILVLPRQDISWPDTELIMFFIWLLMTIKLRRISDAFRISGFRRKGEESVNFGFGVEE